MSRCEWHWHSSNLECRSLQHLTDVAGVVAVAGDDVLGDGDVLVTAVVGVEEIDCEVNCDVGAYLETVENDGLEYYGDDVAVVVLEETKAFVGRKGKAEEVLVPIEGVGRVGRECEGEECWEVGWRWSLCF